MAWQRTIAKATKILQQIRDESGNLLNSQQDFEKG